MNCCTDQTATSYYAPYYDTHACSCFTHAFVSGASVARPSLSGLTSYVDVAVAFSQAVVIPAQGSNWNPNIYPGFTVPSGMAITSTGAGTTRYADAALRPTWSSRTLFNYYVRFVLPVMEPCSIYFVAETVASGGFVSLQSNTITFVEIANSIRFLLTSASFVCDRATLITATASNHALAGGIPQSAITLSAGSITGYAMATGTASSGETIYAAFNITVHSGPVVVNIASSYVAGDTYAPGLSLPACSVQRNHYASTPTLSVHCCTDQSATSFQAPYYDTHFCSCFTHAFVSGSSVPRLSLSGLTSYVDIEVAFSEAVAVPQQGSNWSPNIYPGFTVPNAIVVISNVTGTTRYANAVMRATWSWNTRFNYYVRVVLPVMEPCTVYFARGHAATILDDSAASDSNAIAFVELASSIRHTLSSHSFICGQPTHITVSAAGLSLPSGIPQSAVALSAGTISGYTTASGTMLSGEIIYAQFDVTLSSGSATVSTTSGFTTGDTYAPNLSLGACLVQRANYATIPTIKPLCCASSLDTSDYLPVNGGTADCACFASTSVGGTAVGVLSGFTTFANFEVAFSEPVSITQQGGTWNSNYNQFNQPAGNWFPSRTFTVPSAVVVVSNVTSTVRHVDALMSPTWFWATLYNYNVKFTLPVLESCTVYFAHGVATAIRDGILTADSNAISFTY